MLEAHLLEYAADYSFFEVYEALLLLAKPASKQVEVTPVLGLSQGNGEVDSVVKTENGYHLKVNMPALYGAYSPLANFITDELIQASNEQRFGSKRLLDIVNQQLFSIEYQMHHRQNPATTFNQNQVQRMVLSLTGLSLSDLSAAGKQFKTTHFDLFHYLKGSELGLKALTQRYFQHDNVALKPWITQTVATSPANRLILGDPNSVLDGRLINGARIRHQDRSMRIEVRDVNEHQLHDWLQSDVYWQDFRVLVNDMLQQDLRVDVMFTCSGTNASSGLAQSSVTLGRTSWLATHSHPEHPLHTLTALVNLL